MSKKKGRSTRLPGVKALGDGKYRLRSYRTDPETGRQVETVKTVTAASAEEAYKLKREEAARTKVPRLEEVAERDSTQLGEVARSWLGEILKRKHEEDPTQMHLTPATRDRYTRTVADYIVPAPMAAKDATRVNAEDIKSWRADMLEAGYRRATVNGAHRVLKVILRSIGNNAASQVKALNESPDARITHREPNLLTAVELDRSSRWRSGSGPSTTL